MPDMVALLQCFQPFIAATALRQFDKIVAAMLAMSGRGPACSGPSSVNTCISGTT
jgi:hypothetical protein